MLDDIRIQKLALGDNLNRFLSEAFPLNLADCSVHQAVVVSASEQ